MRSKELLQLVATHVGAASRVTGHHARRRARLVGPDVDVCRAEAALWGALLRRRGRVSARRVELLRAEIAHRRHRRGAGRELRRTEKSAAAVVAETEAQLRTLMEPQQLARYGPFSLFDDSLRGPDWEVSLQSVRAHLVEPGAVILPGAGPALATIPSGLDHPDREHLVVSGRRGVTAVECPAGDDRAGRFARLVNVAALNSTRLDRRRRAAMAVSAERLEETRAWALHRIVEARAEHERVLADRRDVDDAQRALIREQLDTSAVDEGRQQLVLAKRCRANARQTVGLRASASEEARHTVVHVAQRAAGLVRGRAAG